MMPATEPGPEEDEDQPHLGWMASGVGRAQAPVLHRVHAGRARRAAPDHDADAADPAAPPHQADQAGRRPAREPDMRATIRESMRMHGEPPGRLFFRQRKTKLRPLILILDVSGSMADYSRHLLQFAHTARHVGGAGRGVLLRHQADPHHEGAGAPAGRRRPRGGGADRGGLGRRHADRRVARHLRQEMGPRRAVPRRRGGHLLRRAGPRRSRGAARTRWSAWRGCVTVLCG